MTPTTALLAPKDIRLRDVPALRGAIWVRQGFSVFFARPVAFSCLLGLFLIALLGMAMLPWVGPPLVLGSLPLVTLGFMLATQLALRGQSPGPSVFLVPLRVDRGRTVALLKLCLLYALGSAVIMLLCHWIDGGQMAALAADSAQAASGEQAETQAAQALLGNARLQQGMLWRLVLGSVLSLVFWHAPGLVYWGGQDAAKSLFFSTVAVWRTKTAFLVYALVGVAVLMGFGLLVGLVLALLGQPPQWAGVVVMPGMLTFASVFYASLFFTFADSFELLPREPLEPAAA